MYHNFTEELKAGLEIPENRRRLRRLCIRSAKANKNLEPEFGGEFYLGKGLQFMLRLLPSFEQKLCGYLDEIRDGNFKHLDELIEFSEDDVKAERLDNDTISLEHAVFVRDGLKSLKNGNGNFLPTAALIKYCRYKLRDSYSQYITPHWKRGRYVSDFHTHSDGKSPTTTDVVNGPGVVLSARVTRENPNKLYYCTFHYIFNKEPRKLGTFS